MQNIISKVNSLELENQQLRESVAKLEREILKEVRNQLKQELLLRKQLFRITKENNALEARMKMLEEVQMQQRKLANQMARQAAIHSHSGVMSSMDDFHTRKSANFKSMTISLSTEHQNNHSIDSQHQ